jgi:hypothetical protein
MTFDRSKANLALNDTPDNQPNFRSDHGLYSAVMAADLQAK